MARDQRKSSVERNRPSIADEAYPTSAAVRMGIEHVELHVTVPKEATGKKRDQSFLLLLLPEEALELAHSMAHYAVFIQDAPEHKA